MSVSSRPTVGERQSLLGLRRTSIVSAATFLTGSFLSRHGLGTLWAQLFVPASAIICQLLLIRALPGQDANSFFLMLSASMVASVFSDFGQRNTIYTDVGGLYGEPLRTYIRHIYRWRLLCGAAVCAAATLGALLLANHSLVVALLFGVMSANLYQADPGTKLLCGKALGSREIPLSLIDRGLIIVGLIGMCWWGIQSLVLALGIYVVAGLFRLWASMIAVEVHIVQPDRTPTASLAEFDAAIAPPVTRLAQNHFWAGVLLLLTMLGMRLPVLVLPAFQWQDYAAHFGILLAVCQAFVLLPTFVTRVLFPKVLAGNAQASASSLLNQRVLLSGMGICLGCGSLVTLVLYVLAGPLLSVLHPDYATRPELLKLATLSIPLLCAAQFTRLLLTSAGCARTLLMPIAIGSLIGLGTMALLGVRQGPQGILYGYLVAELTAVVLGIAVAHKQIQLAKIS